MAKPTIVTRATKGSALTWTEGDANITNLRDATIGITDGTTSGTLDLNDTLTFTAGSNIDLSYNASTKALTVSNTATAFDATSPGAIGSSTPSTGAFTTLTANTITLDDVRETVYTGGATTGTITPNVANGTIQKITLTGSITFNAFASPVAGQSLTLIITQSAAGGLTLTSTMKFSGASKTLSTAANAVDILTVFYDGTTYWASLGKGFA